MQIAHTHLDQGVHRGQALPDACSANCSDTTCCLSELVDDASFSPDEFCSTSQSSSLQHAQSHVFCSRHLDQQQLDQQQHTFQQTSQQPLHVMLQREPSLLAASLVVKSLLKLANLRAPREVAIQLRQRFMQQLRTTLSSQDDPSSSSAAAAAPTGTSREARLASTLEQLLPWLSTAVTDACCGCKCSCCSATTPSMLEKDVADAVAASIGSYQAYMQKQRSSSGSMAAA